jgi:hypothetical protein
MELADVYLVTERVKRVPARSLDGLARALDAPLPLGYREYLTHLGVGRFSKFLTVSSPERVKKVLSRWREDIAEVVIDGIAVGMYRRGVLSAKRLREAFWVGHTDNGDNFVSTPSCGETLFIVPRDSPTIRELRRGLLDPIACCRAAGVNDVQPWFEADNDRRRLSSCTTTCGAPVVERALMERWGRREVRRFNPTDAQSAVDFGVRAIEGLVKVHAGVQGTTVVTASFDKEFASDVRAFMKEISTRPK